jgi:GH24 family phage-related lysozyme (muramidase)
MQQAVEQVEKCHPQLPAEVLAAFSDAVYNIGPKVACDSTASRLLDQGKLEAACNELPKWNKARVAGQLVELPGLTKRRKKEQEICLSGV